MEKTINSDKSLIEKDKKKVIKTSDKELVERKEGEIFTEDGRQLLT